MKINSTKLLTPEHVRLTLQHNYVVLVQGVSEVQEHRLVVAFKSLVLGEDFGNATNDPGIYIEIKRLFILLCNSVADVNAMLNVGPDLYKSIWARIVVGMRAPMDIVAVEHFRVNTYMIESGLGAMESIAADDVIAVKMDNDNWQYWTYAELYAMTKMAINNDVYNDILNKSVFAELEREQVMLS